MKKIRLICAALVCVICMQLTPVFGYYSDIALPVDYAEAAYRLSDLGIISGYTDGSFRPFDHITRAQFAKMVVCIMDKEDVAVNKGYSSIFPDVADGSWEVPYVNYAAQQGIIKGYADGTFCPDKTITYAEMCAVLLRMLKYYEDSVSYNWAENYIAKANNWGWNQGQSINADAPVTRALGVMAIDDALFEDVNPESENVQKDTCLLELYERTVMDDVVVMSTATEDNSLAWNEMSVLDETGATDGIIYISDITLKDYSSGAIFSHVVIDEDNNHILAAKKYDTQWGSDAAMRELGYTVLTDCHIISSSSYDMSLGSGKVRTSKGEYKTNTSDILSAVGEYGTIVLNKDREIISYSSTEADYTELIITDVDGNDVEYIEGNTLKYLDLPEDFPIYIDYGSKRSYTSAIKEFSGNSLLTLYSTDGGQSYDYGLLESNSGYTVYNECFVAATKAEDSSLSTGQIKTSQGTFKLKNSDLVTQGGTLGTLVLDENKKVTAFAPTNLNSLSVTVNNKTGSQIEYIGSNGVKGTLSLDSNFISYVDYSKTTYAVASSSITSGTDITLYGEIYGDWEFLVVDSTDTLDPVLATKNYTEDSTSMEGIAINHSNLTVYRNGTTANLSSIQKGDVVYYNTKTNIMDVYTKKVTGIYYDAQPSKAYVSVVTVGGKDYTLGTIDAINKMDASVGAYAIGDRVTLHLGKNDEVAFVGEVSGFNYMDYGVVMSVGTRIKEVGDNSGSSEYIATMFMPDGGIYDIVTDKKYESAVGDLVKISESNGVSKLSTMSKTQNFSGTINKAAGTIAGREVADDMVIIQRITDRDGDFVSAEILNFNTLSQTEITIHQTINVISANDFGDIGLLYVEGLTDGGYDYGILTSKKVNENTGLVSYYIYSGGKSTLYSSDYNKSTTSNQPVAFKLVNGQIDDIETLYSVASGSGYSAIDETRIRISSTTYNIDTNARIFCYDGTNYLEKSISDIKNASISSISAYTYSSEKNSDSKTIKVIVYREK